MTVTWLRKWTSMGRPDLERDARQLRLDREHQKMYDQYRWPDTM
jgi:hypothetical protein